MNKLQRKEIIKSNCVLMLVGILAGLLLIAGHIVALGFLVLTVFSMGLIVLLFQLAKIK